MIFTQELCWDLSKTLWTATFTMVFLQYLRYCRTGLQLNKQLQEKHLSQPFQIMRKYAPKISIVIRNGKDSLEDSLDWILLAAELEFLKILVPKLPQHTSNVNIERARKSEWSKQQYSLYVTNFLEHWYILILLLWY